MTIRWKPIILIIALLFLIGCAATAQEEPVADVEPPEAELRKTTLGAGFIPNVQFAPFYVAQNKGFYADEGLEVEIEYGFENDFIALAAQGERDFALASGDQVILARAQGLPITYVMEWYQRYPVALMIPSEQGVTELSDLAGKRVGIPGFFGANFIGWQALAQAGGFDENDVILEDIGFTQAAAVQQGAVDAAMVYIVNEPIQLENQGLAVDVIEVSDYINLISNGLVVGDRLMTEDPELIQSMVRASLRGLSYTLENPDEAFAVVREIIPEMTDEEALVQRQVFDSSLELWRSDELGVSEQAAWQESLDFMSQIGLLESDISVEELYSNRFVDGE